MHNIETNPTFVKAKASLEAHKAKGKAVNKKVAREVVSHHDPFIEPSDSDAIVSKLVQVLK